MAFDYISDSLKQSEWTLGAWDRRIIDGNLSAGMSLFDGRDIFVRTKPDSDRLLVEYDVGLSADDLRPLIWARVVPGPVTNRGEDSCVVTFMVWRMAGESDESWEKEALSFDLEVHMIKGRLEHDF